jgi:lantibiotic modifying enzyme
MSQNIFRDSALERLPSPEQLDQLARASQVGEYALQPQLPRRVADPTLFLGTAGIGYELLRLASPGTLPSVLLME